MIDPNLIRVFLMVAKEGSLHAVAHRLHLTPSAISQRIKALEDYAGRVLFIRKRSGMELNKDGTRLLGICKSFDSTLKGIDSWLTQNQRSEGGDVLVSVVPRLASYLFPGFLKELYSKYPDALIRVEEVDSSVQAEEEVIGGRSDLAIVVGLGKRSSLKVKKLIEHNEVLMVCSADHPLAAKKKLSKDDLKSARIMWHSNLKSRNLQKIRKAFGIAPRQALWLPDMETAKLHVKKGVGISFIARMYIADDLNDGSIVSLPGFKYGAPIFIVSRNEKYEPPFVNAFKHELIRYCLGVDKKLKAEAQRSPR